MADEIVKRDEEAEPIPTTGGPGGGRGVLVFAVLLMIVVLIGAWFLLNRHRDELRQTEVIERAK